MGKRLIIKGADFSANAIGSTPLYENTWYTNQKDKYNSREISTVGIVPFNQASKCWALNDSQHSAMRGKPINAIRLMPSGFTTLNLYKVSSLSSPLPSTPAATATFASGSAFIEVRLNQEITLGDGEYLAFDNGAYAPTINAYDDVDFYRKVGSSEVNVYTAGTTLILLDFGYKN